MKRTKYSLWDGTQKWLNSEDSALAERFFQELSQYMNWSLTAQEALDWMTRQGLNLEDMQLRVMGTDELLQALRQLRQETFQQVNFHNALDDISKKIQKLVELELSTARTELGSIHPQFFQREEFLRGLPLKARESSKAIAKLSEYNTAPGFLDPEAQEIYDELISLLDSVQELEQFILRYGRQFQGPESLDFEKACEVMGRFKGLSEMAEALRAGRFSDISPSEMRSLLGEEAAQSLVFLSGLTETLENEGYINGTPDGIHLTPKGFRKIGKNALSEIFTGLGRDQFGFHEQNSKGNSAALPEDTVPYSFDRPFNVHLVNSIKNAITRNGRLQAQQRGNKGKRVWLAAEDFEVFEEEHESRSATVLLLDMSWSMSRDGRFPAAKRVALALDHLIRITYPRDYYHTIGFSTRARTLNAEQLTEATWDPSDPFTNIQEGLLLSRELLRRNHCLNRQVIVVTDGQPTATHIKGQTNAQWPGFMGSIPPEIHRDTLKEVDNCTREKIRINVFMLDDNPVLTRFVEEIVQINRGRAFYSDPQQLGKYLLVDYLNRRRKQIV